MAKVVKATGVKVGLDHSKYDKSLRDMSAKTKSAVSGITAQFGKMAAGFATIGTAVAAFHKIQSALTETEKAVSALSAVTGSIASARTLFNDLNDLSREIPQSFDEITKSALNLNRAGLRPTNDLIKSLAGIAVGTGKSLDTVSEIFSKAATGQTKALRQLGIVAEDAGNQLRLTFRGQSELIDKSTTSLETYIAKLSKARFGETLAYQMDGMIGAQKRLGEAWGDLWRQIAEGGSGSIAVKAINAITSALDGVTNWLKNPQNAAAVSDFFDMVATAVKAPIDIIKQIVSVAGKGYNEIARVCGLSAGSMSEAFSAFFKYISREIKLQVVSFKALFESLDILATGAAKAFGKSTAEIGKTSDKARYLRKFLTSDGQEAYKNTGHSQSLLANDYIRSYLERRSSLSDAEFTKLVEGAAKTDENVAKIWRAANEYADRTDYTATEARSLSNRFAELDAKVKDALKDSGKAPPKAPPAKIKWLEPKADPTGGKAGGGTAGKDARLAQINELSRAYAKLREQLAETAKAKLDDIDAENARYSEQLSLLDQVLNAKIVSQQEYYNTLQTLEAQHLSKITELQNAHYAEERAARQQQLAEIEQQKNYWGNTDDSLSPLTEFTERLNRYGLQWGDILTNNAKMAKMSSAQIAGMYSEANNALSQYFAGMTSGLNTASGEYKALFAMQKGFAVASSLMSVYQGVANAMAAPWPTNLVAWMSVLAQGMSIIGQIKSINYAGAYDKGGTIPAGAYGLVGEIGPEIVAGPANVTGRKATADMLNKSGNITVNLIEDASRAGQVSKDTTDEETIINVIVANIRAGGDVDGALSSTYNLNRAGA